MVTARAVPILSDNYAWLLRDEGSGATAIVDPAAAEPIVAAIEQAGGRLDLILVTHHHDDHIAAVDAIRTRYGAKVVGAQADAHRLPKLDQAVAEGDVVTLGGADAKVIDTPGHTRGHISYFFAAGGVLLCADTLFSLGCGRLLEGTADEMFASLQKLAALPDETLVCCGHEYTESNLRFVRSLRPDEVPQDAVATFGSRIEAQRAAGQPTVPSRLGDERTANPFLRAPDVATLADLRGRKDRF